MEQITFEQLPMAVSLLNQKLENIEKILISGLITENKKESEDKLLNVEEAAKFLHLAVPTIRSKASRKELPFMKRGKLLYFSQKELSDYLKKGKVKSNDEIEAEADKYFSKKIKK